MHQIDHWINGKRVPGTSGRTGVVYNPATGEQTGEVAFASVAEVDATVAVAKAAAPAWPSRKAPNAPGCSSRPLHRLRRESTGEIIT